jgi:hypothetical protein
MRDPKNGIPPILLLLATTLRSMTAVAAPCNENTSMPLSALLDATLLTAVTLSDAAVVDEPATTIPSLLLLFVVTLLSTLVTTADPVGWIVIPPPKLLEAIVFDTEKLLDVLGTILMPVSAKFRMTQFSISRFPPVVNWMPFAPLRSHWMVRPRRCTLSPAPAVIVTPLPEEVPMVAAPAPSLTMLIALVMVTMP